MKGALGKSVKRKQRLQEGEETPNAHWKANLVQMYAEERTLNEIKVK